MDKVTSILLANTILFSITQKDSDEDPNILDITFNENYTFDSESTSNVLQSNSVVADNIINQPKVVKVSGAVSDTPIEWGIVSTLSRSKDFYKNLMSIRDNKILVTVTTGLDVFESMQLKTISITRDKDKSKALFVDLTFKEFKIVTISETNINQSEVQEQHQSATSATQDKGTVQTTAVQEQGAISKFWGWIS
jgi:hypothetical protein